jgi:pimeloyl-ACP methyl ester carboxylesterase
MKMSVRASATAAAVVLFLAGTGSASADSVTGTPASLVAPDGVRLAATYYSAGRPGPGILLCHQCNMDRKSWNALAEKLARAGFHVLTIDNRGFGESAGARHNDLPDAERARLVRDVWPGDFDVAYKYLAAQPGVRGVTGAGGASCGVNNSIQLSRRHPEIKSLVLLSGFTDDAGRAHLKGKTSPPLFLAAADDDGNAVLLMEVLDASSNNATNRFVEYKAGGHGVVMFGSHPELPDQIVAWYEATLLGKGAPASTDNRARRESPQVRLLVMTQEPGGFAKAAEALEAAKKTDPKSPILERRFVNFLGYTAIQSEDAKSAIAIMRVNVDANPQSSNAWDSLGDAYLADGQKDKAREAAEKSLKLVDSDLSVPEAQRAEIRKSAQGKLDQLKAGATK